MPRWMGWTTPTTPATNLALNWEQWCAHQQRGMSREKRQHENKAFSDRELAQLSFMRWRYQRGSLESGRLDP